MTDFIDCKPADACYVFEELERETNIAMGHEKEGISTELAFWRLLGEIKGRILPKLKRMKESKEGGGTA